jgi:hypothetical protein
MLDRVDAQSQEAGACGLMLAVHSANRGARKFYLACDFVQALIQPGTRVCASA